MRVPHSAKASIAALALTALVIGCGGDSTAPDAPFDPAGTSSDIAAIDASFESPATAGFAAASGSISTVLGGSPAALAVKAMPTKSLIAGGKKGVSHYATTVAKAYRQPSGNGAAYVTAASIPAEYLGVTFTYNVDTDQYEASEVTGAPENGVRFLVYAVNPISGLIIEPLVEVGYADIVTTESASAVTVRVELVSAGVTYLDYLVGVTGSTNSATVSVSGYVSNGDDRVNFDLDTHLTSTALTADYVLIVPTRNGFRMDFEGTITETSSNSRLEARGAHGTVVVTGEHAGTSGTFEVTVNGDLFATIEYTQGQEPVITGADGQPLTEQELEALGNVFEVFIEGFDFVEDLVDPLT
ncbi:MAG TPA: hypothetical protein VH680_06255 [Gemmatimonadales bacterium]|jgi:hypothetical protein